MSFRLKAAPPPDTDSDDSLDGRQDESVQKRLKLMREIADKKKSSKSEFLGGIVVTSEHQSDTLSASASLSAAEKKGLKEVEELERELDLKNTFSKETNRRDEDAEMNRYIDEQIRQRRLEAERERRKQENQERKVEREQSSELSDLFTLPAGAVDPANAKVDDILLHQLVKNYSTKTDEKSEAMLSSQMLNGIPEVDLGLSERIRTIEATEEAKIRLASRSHPQSSKRTSSTAPINYSTNFQQHRFRGKNEADHRSSHQSHDVNNAGAKTICEPVVIVGEEPREIELRLPSTGNDQSRPPARGRASDDYHLQKFKKNSRR